MVVLYVLVVCPYTGGMATQTRRQTAKPQDSAQLWRAEVFGGLELLRARYFEFNYALHTHDEFMIGVIESGVARPHIWGGVQRVRAGDVFVLSPGVVHGGGPTGESMWVYRSFYPPVALMRQAARELTGTDQGVPQFAEDIISDPVIATQLRQAHRALESPGSALAHEAALLPALVSLVVRHGMGKRAAPRVGVEHRAVGRVKAYLEALPGENVALETLAREAGISAFHLCRVFRRETGLTPQAYQILVRARLAKTLLMGGMSISQAALEAGFFDQAHLTRHFKRIFGVTPGQYLGSALPPAM